MVLFLSLAENCWPLHIVYLLFYLRFIFNFFSPLFSLDKVLSFNRRHPVSVPFFFSGRLNYFFFFLLFELKTRYVAVALLT